MIETYQTALHLPFNQAKEVNQQMSKLYSQLLAVFVTEGQPMLQSIVKLNEDFELVYTTHKNIQEVVDYYIDKFGLVINKTKGTK